MLNYTRRARGYVLTDGFKIFRRKIIEAFFDVLQVLVFILRVYKYRIFNKPAVSSTFCSLADIPFPVAQFAQKEVRYYAVCSVCIIPGIAGERMRGNSLMVTIRPVLHAGQMQGLIPVRRSNRCRLDSGGSPFFIIASISGFSSTVNCKARFRLVV